MYSNGKHPWRRGRDLAFHGHSEAFYASNRTIKVAKSLKGMQTLHEFIERGLKVGLLRNIPTIRGL